MKHRLCGATLHGNGEESLAAVQKSSVIVNIVSHHLLQRSELRPRKTSKMFGHVAEKFVVVTKTATLVSAIPDECAAKHNPET